MVAIYEDGDGIRRYYIPPPPPPPPPPPKPKIGTNAPGFQQEVAVAKQATGAYAAGHGTKTTALNDWAEVGATIANQYRIAWTSADPKAAVAALDRQYNNYFQNEGRDTTIYNGVVASAKGEVQGETTGQRQAEVQYANAQSEPAGAKSTADIETAAIAVTKANINAELQTKFGNGNDGVYTVAQIKAAAAAVLGQLDPKAAPLVEFVATDMEDGQSLSDVLSVLQSKGLKLTPAEIRSGTVGSLKLTPAEIKSGTLILTPAEAQIAKIDPVTLAFLKADGITVTQLSPEMAQLAKESPSLFAFMEVNGVNITTVNGAGPTGANSTAYRLGSGNYLNVTVNGKAFDVNYVGSDKKPVTPSTVVSAYEYFNATNPGQGIVALANMLLPQLTVNGNTLATDPKLGNLAMLMQAADSERSQLAGGQLKTLMGAAPGAADKNAPSYIGNTVNPFLTTQLNGFFNPAARQAFWSNAAQPLLQPYLQTGLGAQFKHGDRSLMYAGGYAKQAVAGASPEEAKMLISLVEGQVNKFNLGAQGLPLPAQPLLSALGTAVQIADQMPNSDGTNAATQVADWLNSGGPQIRLLQGAGANLYYDAAQGNYDLANAIVNSIESLGGGRNLYKYTVELGGIIADNVQRGEQAYDTSIQNKIGAQNYDIFEKNKDSILKTYFNQFANDPNIGQAHALSSLSNTALDDIIGKAMNLTPTDQASAKALDYTKNWYTPNAANPSSTQNWNTIQLLQQWIRSQSHANSTLTALPILYASDAEGVVNSSLFEVDTPDHKYERGRGNVQVTDQTVIDGSAALDALAMNGGAPVNPNDVSVQWHYSSIADFQHNNKYSGGDIYQLVTQNGHVSYQDMAAHITTLGQRIKQGVGDTLDAAAVVGLFVPGLDVFSAAALAAVAWGLYSSIDELAKMHSEGESIGWSNATARGQWINIIGDAAAMGKFGAVAALDSGIVDGANFGGKLVGKLGNVAGGVATYIGAEQTMSMIPTIASTWNSVGTGTKIDELGTLVAGVGQIALGSMRPHEVGGDPAPRTRIATDAYQAWAGDGRPSGGATAAVWSGAEEILHNESWVASGGPMDPYWQQAVSDFQPQIDNRAQDLAGGPTASPTAAQITAAETEFVPQIARKASDLWQADGKPPGVSGVDRWRTAKRKFDDTIAYSYRARQVVPKVGENAYKAWVVAGKPTDANFDTAVADFRSQIDTRAEQLAGGPGHTPTSKQTAQAEAEFGPQIGTRAHELWQAGTSTTSALWTRAERVFRKGAGADNFAFWQSAGKPLGLDTKYWDGATQQISRQIALRAHEIWHGDGRRRAPSGLFWTRDATSSWRQADNAYTTGVQSADQTLSNATTAAKDTYSATESAANVTFDSAMDASYQAWVTAGRPRLAHWQDAINDPGIAGIDARANDLWVADGSRGAGPTAAMRTQAEAAYGRDIATAAFEHWVGGTMSPKVRFNSEWTPARLARDSIKQAEQVRDDALKQATKAHGTEVTSLVDVQRDAIAGSYLRWDKSGKPTGLKQGYWRTAEREAAQSPSTARTAWETAVDFGRKMKIRVSDPDTAYNTQAGRYISQGKSILKTLGKGYAISNGVGIAAWAAWYFGMRNYRNGSPVTATTAYGQLQQLQADPDGYMKQHYHTTVIGIPISEGAVEGVNRTGHLLEVPDSSGKPSYFRRVPDDLFNALRQSPDSNVRVKDGQVFVTETLQEGNKKVPITVEIVPPYQNQATRDVFTHSTNSDASGGRIDLNFGFGPIEGDRLHLNFELNGGYRYSAPNVTTLRAAMPSHDQGLQAGIRQQNTTYLYDVTLSMGSMDFNAAQVTDLTEKGSVFNGNEWMLGNFRAYWYIGNRNREEFNTTGSSTFVRTRETGFSEIGVGADFAKFVYANKNYVSLNGYYELQLYAPDFRDQADFGKGLITTSQTMQPLPPLFLIDPALQITATSQLPYTSYKIPRLTDLPYLSPSS